MCTNGPAAADSSRIGGFSSRGGFFGLSAALAALQEVAETQVEAIDRAAQVCVGSNVTPASKPAVISGSVSVTEGRSASMGLERRRTTRQMMIGKITKTKIAAIGNTPVLRASETAGEIPAFNKTFHCVED